VRQAADIVPREYQAALFEEAKAGNVRVLLSYSWIWVWVSTQQHQLHILLTAVYKTRGPQPYCSAVHSYHPLARTHSAVIPSPAAIESGGQSALTACCEASQICQLRHVTCGPPAVAMRSWGTAQIIAFLDTGAGKTLISVLLIRHIAPLLRKCAAAAAPAESDGGCARARVLAPLAQRKSKLAFFLAPTVSLVKQVTPGRPQVTVLSLLLLCCAA